MEVILREHVEHLGKRGDVVKVAAGYARNFLLPRKLALAVTEASRRQIERERASAEAREAEETAAARALADRLEQAEVVIARRAGEGDALYGSVTTADIAESLAAQGFEIDKRKIQMADPIRSISESTVPVKVHRDVTANVTVKVVAQ
jgi:large subunit ribosomal protein L9